MLTKMIEQRVRNEAMKQAQTEVDAIEVITKEALEKIGITYLPAMYNMFVAIRGVRIEALVHARLQAVADSLMAGPRAKPDALLLSADNAEMIAQLKQATAYIQRMSANLDRFTEGVHAIRTQA